LTEDLVHIEARGKTWLIFIQIIWTYQDMMEWMSRISVGEMAGADEDFGSEVRKAADFGSHTFSSPT
jgi:hypothetical protein